MAGPRQAVHAPEYALSDVGCCIFGALSVFIISSHMFWLSEDTDIINVHREMCLEGNWLLRHCVFCFTIKRGARVSVREVFYGNVA